MAKGVRHNQVKKGSEKQFHRIKRCKTKAKKKFAQQQRKLVATQIMALDEKMSKKQEKKLAKKLKKVATKKGMDVDVDVVEEGEEVLPTVTTTTPGQTTEISAGADNVDVNTTVPAPASLATATAGDTVEGDQEEEMTY